MNWTWKKKKWIWWLYLQILIDDCTELEEEIDGIKDLEEESKDAGTAGESAESVTTKADSDNETESEEIVAAEGVQENLANKVESDKTRCLSI